MLHSHGAKLNKIFKPAFLGRLVIIPYFPIRDENLKMIIRLKLNKIVKRVQAHYGAKLSYTPQLVDAVAAQLGTQAFMLGDEPSSLDATAYAFLANLLWAPYEMPMRRHAQSLPALEAYCQRMKARYFGDDGARPGAAAAGAVEA